MIIIKNVINFNILHNKDYIIGENISKFVH